ncbi:peroxisomal multifunctional enzyme type 2 [Diachasma alloeum]|uniref:peroxisomal multifunctional enzyme type 2 n=1 Tax=Diachasma alloeum TaxID=454923 RepID=UPI0007381949|nr:peroxisomal multifunctional enzyme type 2 [Diachasma alloeum]
MSDSLRFDGKVVVVTGAGAGLGRAYALLFASRGAKVVVNDLGGGRDGDGSSTKAADTVVTEITSAGGVAVPNYDSVLDGQKIIQTAIANFGRIDILINNAGILRDRSFLKMTDQDWDLIHDVHVKGSMLTTRAAWPHFRRQKYGRVIFTSSNSGMYGNFGQPNYSAAKMALVGLSNTLAIEGSSANIKTNVIIPTAGSRLTEDILPPELFNELKPEFIAPVVMWLCHEDCNETGAIIESALGWAGKCHLIRGNGAVLRKSLKDSVTPEDVRNNWATVVNMEGAKRCETIGEATGELMNVMEVLGTNKSDADGDKSGVMDYSMKNQYDFKQVILYALSVGAKLKDPMDFRYLYENHSDFAVVPCYYVVFGPATLMETDIIEKAFKGRSVNLAGIVHGEQYMKILQKIPTEAVIETKCKVLDVLDKGRNAVLLIEHETFNSETGEKLTTGRISAIARGAGGFGGPKQSHNEIPGVEAPKRAPDASYSEQTSTEQAALYRLSSGDLNPLHVDPSIAEMGGFKEPILHGLCSLGFATRHVLKMFAGGDPELFDSFRARFSKPVVPGQTLRTDMWRDGNRIHFQCVVVDTNNLVVTNAYVDLKKVKIGTKAKL